MRIAVIRALLVMGAIAGFASGFSGVRRCREHHRAAFEQHVADVCVRAARHAADGREPRP